MPNAFILCYKNINNSFNDDFFWTSFQKERIIDPNVLLTGATITIKYNRGHYANYEFSIKLSFTFDIDQPKPLRFDNVTLVRLSQLVIKDNKSYTENQHYLIWENTLNKRIEEVLNLKKDRDRILDKLGQCDCDDDKQENIELDSNQDLLKEVEQLSQQINNHNKEIKIIETTSTNIEYVKEIQTNYIDLEKNYIGQMDLIDQSKYPFLDQKNGIKEYLSYEFYWYVDNVDTDHKKVNPNKISITQETITILVPKLSPQYKTKRQKINNR